LVNTSSPNERPTELALQAALAEFNGIRARMDVFSQAQVTLFTAGITAIGVIAGLALDKQKYNLLLFISIVAPVLVSTHSDLRNRIGMNGAYIRFKLWPYIVELTDPKLPSWEDQWRTKVDQRLVLLGVSQAPALLLSASVAVLVIRIGALSETHADGYGILWCFGVALTVLSSLYTLAVFHALRKPRQDEREHLESVS
jgi:hypothetical protein